MGKLTSNDPDKPFVCELTDINSNFSVIKAGISTVPHHKFPIFKPKISGIDEIEVNNGSFLSVKNYIQLKKITANNGIVKLKDEYEYKPGTIEVGIQGGSDVTISVKNFVPINLSICNVGSFQYILNSKKYIINSNANISMPESNFDKMIKLSDFLRSKFSNQQGLTIDYSDAAGFREYNKLVSDFGKSFVQTFVNSTEYLDDNNIIISKNKVDFIKLDYFITKNYLALAAITKNPDSRLGDKLNQDMAFEIISFLTLNDVVLPSGDINIQEIIE